MIKKKLNNLCGERLRQCLEASHMTQKELSEQTNYSAQYISYIVTGKRSASAEALIIFAKVLNVRKEYLLCEDDYRTIEEEQQALRISDKKNIEYVLKYLDFLGYSFQPRYTIQLDICTLYFCFNDIKKYIITDDLEMLNNKYDFSLSIEDFCQIYGTEQGISHETISVKPSFPGIQQYLDSRSEGAEINQRYTSFDFSGCYAMADAFYCYINSKYILYQNNEYIKSVSHKELLRFLDILDNYVKCTIENLLLNQRILSIEPSDIIEEGRLDSKKILVCNAEYGAPTINLKEYFTKEKREKFARKCIEEDISRRKETPN